MTLISAKMEMDGGCLDNPPNTAAFTCLRSLPIFRWVWWYWLLDHQERTTRAFWVLQVANMCLHEYVISSLFHLYGYVRVMVGIGSRPDQGLKWFIQANLQKKNIVCSTLQYSISVYLSIYSISPSFQTYIIYKKDQKRLFLPAFPPLFNLFPLCFRAFRLSRTVPTSRTFCLNGTILLNKGDDTKMHHEPLLDPQNICRKHGKSTW